MPSVTVLSSTPALRDFGPPSATDSSFGSRSGAGAGNPRNHESVVEIKEKVRANVQRAVRGASALSILRIARDQAAHASSLEDEGDISGALRCCLTAAQLAQRVYDHPEFRQEKEGKKGVVWKELSEFQKHHGDALVTRAKALEAKLLDQEKVRRSPEQSDESAGKSIADRMRSLQNAGLAVETTKRISRDLSTTSPSSDWKTGAISRASSSQNPPSHSRTSSQVHSPVISGHATGSSSHSFVSPSSFGPPSPSSSTASSPHLSHFTFSEFNQTFPSIDEIDEGASLRFPELPSVPTNKPGTAGPSVISPTISQQFPTLPLDLDPGPRPASTPVAPTAYPYNSRPPSPHAPPHRSPLSPTIPPKPANLTLTGGSSPRGPPSQSSPMNTGDSHRLRSIDLPVTNSIFPKKLQEYLDRGSGLKVLLLDIRTRDEFSKGHVKSDSVVCLEPYVLSRNGLTGEQLEDALSVAPANESKLFRNRGMFDLIVMYDNDSQLFGTSISPMSTAVRVIYETAIHQMLKRPPVILVGGLKAWQEMFPGEVASDSSDLNGLDMGRVKISSPLNSIKSTLPVSQDNIPHGVGTSSVHELWSPAPSPRSMHLMDQISEDKSSSSVNGQTAEPARRLIRKPTMTRPPSSSSLTFNVRGLYDNSSSYLNGSTTSLTYPSYSRQSSTFGNSISSPSGQAGIASPPPTATVNPSALSRRRNDFVDQSEQAVSSFASRPSIDYPDLSSQQLVRLPPAAATPPSERQDRRSSAHATRPSIAAIDMPRPPIIHSEYPVIYWPDVQISTSGLKNLGNTCYMNSTIQCLSATMPFSRFFIDGRWKHAVNMLNPLGTKGQLTAAFALLLRDLWHQDSPVITPHAFRNTVCKYSQQFSGNEQHDSQEFLNTLLDGLHEDLNRILKKPPVQMTPEREAELERLPQQIASQQEWSVYRMRDDSIVVDFFQGQFRNRMECLTCRKTSTTYNSFMYLSMPLPQTRGRATLQQCLDMFVQEEVMEKADAWHCPNCKQLRKATKRLSISRLPPVLLIHLKRFQTKGHFTDKLETDVDFPLRGLDMTNYMPPPLPPGTEGKPSTPISLDDPRSQVPPYQYDLYAVTNHFGTLSSGHYTAFINSRGGWLYCEDSRITTADERKVVGKPAYVLYYKRVKA